MAATGRHGLRGNDNAYQIPGKYPKGAHQAAPDPLDGPSNIDVNVSVGTTFRYRGPDRNGDEGDLGEEASYSPAPNRWRLVMRSTARNHADADLGDGVKGFTLDRELGNQGGLERIVLYWGGSLLLVVGYYSTLPPKRLDHQAEQVQASGRSVLLDLCYWRPTP
jgi:hypothetical protein